ncbi:hypothetical protein [uncultured Endozoicomonas sp.]|uniref:hypothetical protein n=1 Tax=uncultured Endozoicomonas sp. TaxID=432652 RepID=UPI00262C20B5|nr:hypothetical protein [uncultured Endozoicomonas sp.]
MDSEQIQHRLNLEKAMVGAEFRAPQESNSSLHQSPIEPQMRSQQGESTADNGMSSDEAWKIESAQQERKLLMTIEDIKKAEIDDKLEFKKYLADLYKQSNSLMTIYNQRVQNLLLDDRFLHRHTNEISSLLIRGLMPPLEEVKSIEKSLTSTRKKAKEETIVEQTSTAVKEMQKVEAICKDVKSRIIKYTRAPKPIKIAKKAQDKPLDQHAISLQNAIKQVNPAPFQQKAELPVSKNTLLSTETQNLKAKQESAPKEPESVKSKQLKVLVDNLLPSDTVQNEKVQRLIEQEYQKYSDLQSFLSVARQKCHLLGMRADKVCDACESALSKLDSFRSDSSFTMSELFEVDKAIQTLEKFDKKLPGEVWQLLTELKPGVADHRHHLLNLQCRKLLMDGPATMTQKPELKQFMEVEHYLNLFNKDSTEEIFTQQFLTVFGELYVSPSQFKKSLSVTNKPQELLALINIFQAQHSSDIFRFTELTKKASMVNNQKNIEILETGIKAIEYITGELNKDLQAEAQNFRLSEPGSEYKKLEQTLLIKLTAYFEAKSISRAPETPNKPINKQAPPHKAVVQRLSNALIQHNQNNDGEPLKPLFNKISDLDEFTKMEKSEHRKFNIIIISSVLEKGLTSETINEIVPLWLEYHSSICDPEFTEIKQKQYFNKELPTEVCQALRNLEQKSPSSWFNQIFNTSTREFQLKALDLVELLLPLSTACGAHPFIISEFISDLSSVLHDRQNDSLIEALCKALDNYQLIIKADYGALC